MPIQCCFDVEEMSKDCFHKIEYLVMRDVFDVQNELGRLCHETIYQAELIHRCRDRELPAMAEGEIIVSHDSFRKSILIKIRII